METVTVGCCIYCRSGVNLSREHIIPYGLNGEWILQKASCDQCARITGRIEQHVLRNAFFGPRTSFQMQTYNPKGRKKKLPLHVEKGGTRHVIHVPVEDYPVYMAMPQFDPPAHISGTPYHSGVNIRIRNIAHIGGPTFPELARKYEFDYIGVRLEYEPILFARMLAKIGFGMAVFSLGLNAIRENYVLPAILGKTQDVGRWVGSEESVPVNPTHGLHAVDVRAIGKEIQARIRLFAQFQQAEYLVIARHRF